VWTGAELLVWMGAGGASARYDPLADSWKPISPPAQAHALQYSTEVWTSREMVVVSWTTGGSPTAERYDPIADAWTPVSTLHAPVWWHSGIAAWTGERMIVWGGQYSSWTNFYNSGGSYRPGVYDGTAPAVDIDDTVFHGAASTFFELQFSADDEDGIPGGVVHEAVWLDACRLLDGDSFGDRDGLLSDERIVLDRAAFCRAAAACKLEPRALVMVEVEATDCAGNPGIDRRTQRLGRPGARPGVDSTPALCSGPLRSERVERPDAQRRRN
jgi:hypothetical protein